MNSHSDDVTDDSEWGRAFMFKYVANYPQEHTEKNEKIKLLCV